MEFHSLILERLGDGVVAVDRADRTTFMNPAAERILGPEALRPDRGCWVARSVWLPDGTGRFPRDHMPLSRALNGEEVDDAEFLVRRDDGREVHVSSTARPLRDATGAIVGAVAVFRDVTTLRSRELALKREATLLALVRGAGAATNESRTLAGALEAALAAIGEVLRWPVGHAWVRDEEAGALVSTGVWHLDDPPRYAELRAQTEALQRHAAHGLVMRVVGTRAPVWIPDTAAAQDDRRDALVAAGLRVAVGAPILVAEEVVGVLELFGREPLPRDALLLDALAQAGAQLGRAIERERAARREDFVQAIVDHVADPIFVKDRRFRWVYLSRAFCEMVGHPREAMIGRTDYDFFPKEEADFFRKKDIEMFGREQEVAIEEEPITDAAGHTHWLATTKTPLRFSSPGVTHLVGVIHDISRLKTVEELLRQKNAELQEQVAQTAAGLTQLDSSHRELETFCYTVSHDLRAPLRAIDGFSRILEEESRDCLDETAIRHLGRIRAATARMARLIDDLLDLSRVSRHELLRDRVDLGALAQSVIADLRAGDPTRDVEVVIAASLWADGDATLLRSLLQNLLENAWKFSAARARAHIEVGVRREGGEQVYYVRDDGVGFDMAFVDRLFAPFQRLHGMAEFPGTGIGLATAKRIVERHGGRLWAESAVDRGATFSFTLAAGQAG